MVFYGKKNTLSHINRENYVSIEEQITRQLGSRHHPAKQKSIATIIQTAGDICLKGIVAVLTIPQSFKNSEFYTFYQMDKQSFRLEWQQVEDHFQFKNMLSNFPQKLSERKFELIQHSTTKDRLLKLNFTMFFANILFLRSKVPIGRSLKRVFLGNLLLYPLASLVYVPEVYGSLLSKK